MDAGTIQHILWQLEALASYVNHSATFELVELVGEGDVRSRIETAYPDHAPCKLVAVPAWREALRTAIRGVALDDNQVVAERLHDLTPVIEQVMVALDTWLAPYDVACFDVRHPSEAHGAGLFGYLVDATHALVLRGRDGELAMMFLFGIGWSD